MYIFCIAIYIPIFSIYNRYVFGFGYECILFFCISYTKLFFKNTTHLSFGLPRWIKNGNAAIIFLIYNSRYSVCLWRNIIALIGFYKYIFFVPCYLWYIREIIERIITEILLLYITREHFISKLLSCYVSLVFVIPEMLLKCKRNKFAVRSIIKRIVFSGCFIPYNIKSVFIFWKLKIFINFFNFTNEFRTCYLYCLCIFRFI